MTNRAFEESIEVSNGYINSISKSIGLDKLETIIEKYPNLNVEWLFTGNGNSTCYRLDVQQLLTLP